MKKFLITYKENSKYGPDLFLHKIVTLSKSTGDIGFDAKSALGIFISTTGTLKKNDVVSIQELDDRGFPVGEPIKPMENSTIVPTGKQKRQ